MSKARDQVAMLMAGIVGIFVVGSLAIILVLVFTGVAPGDNIWAGLFSMMTAILGGVGGYMGGVAMEAKRNAAEAAPPVPVQVLEPEPGALQDVVDEALNQPYAPFDDEHPPTTHYREP